MSKHNYSQYSNKKKSDNEFDAVEAKKRPMDNRPKRVDNPVEQEVVKPKITQEAAPRIAPQPSLVKETVETVTLPEMVEGVVVGCAKLNVRAEPSITADVVCILDGMAELEVDVTNSNNEWVKVCTAIGVEGYCMRKFIDVKL